MTSSTACSSRRTVRVVHSQGDVLRDESGHPVRHFGVVQDITELRQAEEALRESEQRYRTLFEKASDAIFLKNEHDEIVEVNEPACTLLGYCRDELLKMESVRPAGSGGARTGRAGSRADGQA